MGLEYRDSGHWNFSTYQSRLSMIPCSMSNQRQVRIRGVSMYRFPRILIIPCLMIGLLVLGCGGDEQVPEKALIITGAEELVGATVFLDGVELGPLEVLEKPPGLVVWAVSLINGNRGPYEDDHNTVALVFDLEGTVSGTHLVVVEHPSFESIEKPFTYPDDLEMKENQPNTGVVFFACTPFDLKPISG